MEKHIPGTPEDFDPLRAVDALLGLSEAIHWYLTEGPAAEEPIPRDARAAINGLAWTAARLSRQLHEHFRALSEAGFEFPETSSETGGVRERSAPYAIN